MELPKLFHPVKITDKSGNTIEGYLAHTGEFCAGGTILKASMVEKWEYIFSESK